MSKEITILQDKVLDRDSILSNAINTDKGQQKKIHKLKTVNIFYKSTTVVFIVATIMLLIL